MSPRKAITEADVRAILPAATLEVPEGSVVTPAARDLAKKLGVAIVEVAGQADAPAPKASGRASRQAARPPAAGARAEAPPRQPTGAEAPAGPSGPGGADRGLQPVPAAAPATGIMRAVTAPPQAGPKKVVALGADHGGFPMKEALKALVTGLGHEVLDCGTGSADPVDYPDFAIMVARAVASGRAWRGIMVDGAGIGSAMAANKVPGVRAALCHDVTTAENAREHNDATVLTLGGTLIGQRLAGEIVRTFLTTDFGGGRHQARVAKINALDTR